MDALGCCVGSARRPDFAGDRKTVTPPASPATSHKPSTVARLWRFSRSALPPARIAFPGALLWAALMAGGVLASLLLAGWQTPAKIRFVALLFAAGGASAFPVGLFAARLVSPGRRPEAAFAAAFVCLLVATIGFTSGFYGLQYRLYYAEWHAPAFTRLWANEYFYTFAASLYQFAVLGMRLYFPVGLIALFGAGLWFARQPR